MTREIKFLIAICGLLSVSLVSFAERVKFVETAAGENTSLSRLVVDTNEKLHLSWVKTEGDHQSLYYASLNNDAFGVAKLISQGENWFVNWADFPSLVVNENGMAAHWLQMSAEGTYDYDVRASFFDTEKQSWRTNIIVHKDGINAEHGFVSMLPMAGNKTFITWLDGRLTKTKDEQGHPGGMTLRAGVFDGEGKVLEDWLLDDLTCDCCQTSAAMSGTGPMVAYRDRTKDEVRDIYITRLENDTWSEPVAISNDNWIVAGCPVNGPDIASKNDLTAVAWFSAKNDHPEVKLVFSHDDGQTFSDPVVVASKTTNGRVGVTILDSGLVAVTWLETAGEDAKIMMAIYDKELEKSAVLVESLVIAETKSSRRSGFPTVESIGNQIFVTWTDLSSASKVQVAMFSLTAT
ncbi:MAG: hypothetical protein ACI9FB_001877 [Candidatus Azotimanducaceae bacterium]|jgi:hypothetical protein